MKEKAYPFLSKGRPGDWNHTLRVIEFGKILAEAEGGDPEIILAALVLHDLGWSQVDYSDFINAPIFQKKDAQSVKDHMVQSTLLARDILEELDFPAEKSELVLRIISHHDQPEIIQSMAEIEATVVFEADRLDRFGPESLKRCRQIFDGDYPEKSRDFLAWGAKTWFRTPTGIKMVQELIAQIPSEDQDP
jgi:HD superfamily phosphodiesterase